MRVTSENIAAGLSSFIREDVVNSVPDTAMKIMLTALATMIAVPDTVDRFMTGNALTAMLRNEDGTYELQNVAEALKGAMNKHGALKVTVPAIPLISRSTKEMSFSSSDIDRLLQRIERGEY